MDGHFKVARLSHRGDVYCVSAETDFDLMNVALATFERPLSGVPQNRLSSVGPKAAELVRDILIMRGVSKVQITPLKADIYLSRGLPTAGIEQIEKCLIEVLNRVYEMDPPVPHAVDLR